jgi:predicted metal-dependent phosphotriesterase family hydrolase
MEAPIPARRVMTVLGSIVPEQLGITDGHNHVWIEAVPGGAASAPVLTQEELILSGLDAYRRAGGGAIIDCQPGGCGRDGRRLRHLAQASQVHLVACTGFHRRRYYPVDFDLWSLSAEAAAERFGAELNLGLAETQGFTPVRAGFVKAACEARLSDTPRAALEGAAGAAAASGAALMVHTEKGAAVEDMLSFFTTRGVSAGQLVLCHIDKRPDFGLHRELAQAGVLLEYDTFYRPQYDPEANLWPLIARMAAAGLDHRIALATDMAEAELWRAPGLEGLLTIIRPRLLTLGLEPGAIERMLGGNIAARLAYHHSGETI